jgi:hypothetical protein
MQGKALGHTARPAEDDRGAAMLGPANNTRARERPGSSSWGREREEEVGRRTNRRTGTYLAGRCLLWLATGTYGNVCTHTQRERDKKRERERERPRERELGRNRQAMDRAGWWTCRLGSGWCREAVSERESDGGIGESETGGRQVYFGRGSSWLLW